MIKTQVPFQLHLYSTDNVSTSISVNLKDSPIRFIGREDFASNFDVFHPSEARDMVVLNQFGSIAVTAEFKGVDVKFTFTPALKGNVPSVLAGNFVYS